MDSTIPAALCDLLDELDQLLRNDDLDGARARLHAARQQVDQEEME
jgi:hypothetical protein